MNTTERGEQMYWHVYFYGQPDGAIRPNFRKGVNPIDVSEYLVEEG